MELAGGTVSLRRSFAEFTARAASFSWRQTLLPRTATAGARATQVGAWYADGLSTGRPRAITFHLASLVLLLASKQAAAALELEASVAWQGDCDDVGALRAEMEARGAHLLVPKSGETALKLDVFVQRTEARALVADVLLSTASTQERRRVEARECVALRQAVAWVLGVLAEERAAEQATAEPSTASFPEPAGPTLPESSRPPVQRSAGPRASQSQPQGPQRRGRPEPCVPGEPRWQFGSELLAGIGFVDAVTIGPALVGLYRPCAKWLPGIAFGVSDLVSLKYAVDSRPIVVERMSAQLGVATALGVPALRAGAVIEAGQIRATGSPSSEGPGGSGSGPWLAFVVPVRLETPLVRRAVTVQMGLDALYTPLSYSLRYASGGQLSRPSHVEVRAALGLAGHF